jgi:hypothetical protein
MGVRRPARVMAMGEARNPTEAMFCILRTGNWQPRSARPCPQVIGNVGSLWWVPQEIPRK